MGVGVCTNATMLTDSQIGEMAMVGGVHVNVSLDGFRAESHGRFRGDRDSFAVTVATVRKLAGAGLLQGLLCTPNSWPRTRSTGSSASSPSRTARPTS